MTNLTAVQDAETKSHLQTLTREQLADEIDRCEKLAARLAAEPRPDEIARQQIASNGDRLAIAYGLWNAAGDVWNGAILRPVTFGTTTKGGQVHMAQARRGHTQILCRFDACAPALETMLGTFPEGGMDSTIATLREAKVRPSKLCKHCFGIRIRKACSENGA